MENTNTKDESTPEELEAEQKDFDDRVKNFNADLIPLLNKYKLALGAIAFINPNGTIASRAQLFDNSKSQKVEEKTGEKTPEINKA